MIQLTAFSGLKQLQFPSATQAGLAMTKTYSNPYVQGTTVPCDDIIMYMTIKHEKMIQLGLIDSMFRSKTIVLCHYPFRACKN